MEKYFVSYVFKNLDGKSGIGNAMICSIPIKGVEETRAIEGDLKKIGGYSSCTIINYKKVSDCVE